MFPLCCFLPCFCPVRQIVVVSVSVKWVARAASLNKCLCTHLVGGGDRPPSCFAYRLYPPKYGNPLHFPW